MNISYSRSAVHLLTLISLLVSLQIRAIRPEKDARGFDEPAWVGQHANLDSLLNGWAAGSAAQDTVITGFAAFHDVSPALRDMRVPPEEPAATFHEIPGPVAVETPGRQAHLPVQDPVVQGSLPGRLSPQASTFISGVNFDGITNIDNIYPPDSNGDVGPNHYVQMVNLHYAIYAKDGTLLLGPLASNTIWSGFGGPCQTRNDGDPIVLYDKIADRWVLSQFAAGNPYGECVAVSTGSDPTGTYNRYFFQFSTTVFYDYPKLGIWPDGYYLTANRFTTSFQGASAIALDRSAMLAGGAAAYQEFQTSTSYGVLLPSSLDGPTLPPAGSPNFLVEIGTNALHLWKFHVDWATPGNSTLSGPTNLPAAAFNALCTATRNCIPQPDTTVKLDDVGDRLMNRLVYRNFGDHEALTVSHAVNVITPPAPYQAGVRWYEIRDPNGTPVIYQQGSYAPDATNRWLSSLAFDHVGNMALGYSASSDAIYPSIRYTGRLFSDPLGSMTEAETTLMAGSGSQTGSASRWGDYVNMAVDPVDDCTFWFTSEYLASTSTASWRTRIASFRFTNCGLTPAATITAVTSDINPSTYGQPVTFSAAVTYRDGTPTTGNVSFYDGLNLLGVTSVNGSGVATFSTSALAAGLHSISASYSGSGIFLSSSGSLAGGQTVNPAAASVNLLDLSQTYDGTPRPISASTVPPGLTVTFLYDGSPNPPTDAGSYKATGFVDDPNYTGSNSAELVIKPAAASVNLLDLSQAYNGTPRPIRAETKPAKLTVIFTYDGSPTPPTNAGKYNVTGTVDSPNYTGTASDTLAVSPVSTNSGLVSSQNPSFFGKPVTFSVTVTSPSGLTPAGSVTFSVDGILNSAAALNGLGVALLAPSALSPGHHSIAVSFNGSTNFAASGPANLTQTVNVSIFIPMIFH